MKIALYPGSFDPITLGHLDVIAASAKIFDKIIVAILRNPNKDPLFSIRERLIMIAEALAEKNISNAEVKVFEGLTVDMAKKCGAKVIIRGLRSPADYETELDMCFNNYQLAPEIRTVFIPPIQNHTHIRSSTVRELINFGKTDLGLYVPETVLKKIKSKMKK